MKHVALREAIATALPELARDPERLAMWIEKGRILSPMTESRNFEWDYTLNITVQEFTSHPSILFLTINDWLRVNQPELLQPGGKAGYHFEVDVIDDATVDLHVALDLTECVTVTRKDDGSDELQHEAEQGDLLPDDLRGANLQRLIMDDVLILPVEAP